MARLNVSVPDELVAEVRERLPGLNVSGVLQRGLSSVLGCAHDALVCVRCTAAVDPRVLVDDALSGFYRDALWSIGELVQVVGTAEGAARVLKDVARRRGVSAAELVPLPRPTRAERETAIA